MRNAGIADVKRSTSKLIAGLTILSIPFAVLWIMHLRQNPLKTALITIGGSMIALGLWLIATKDD